jgi:tetratricopeptide (TPR) repeat protein
MNFQVERLKRLPRRAGEAWQGGIAQMPLWMQEPGDEKPWRPWLAGWASPKVIKISEPGREPNEFDTTLKALADLASDEKMVGYRPGKLQVRDPVLAEYLRDMLAEAEIEIEVRDDLPHFDALLAETAEHFSQRKVPPDALKGKGVTVESMRAFAEAAAEFYRAQPWETLSSEDLIDIETPATAPGLRFASVLGAPGDALGLGFFKSRKEFERLLDNPGPEWLSRGKHWSVLYGPVMEMPFGDADLWETQSLPVVDEEAYPVALCYSAKGKDLRPDVGTLAFFEGLLRALAQTTEAEVDTGRWQKRVETFRGPLEFTLSLPYLLEAQEQGTGRQRGAALLNPLLMEEFMSSVEDVMKEGELESEEEVAAVVREKFAGRDLGRQEPATPLEEAQNLVYEAYNARGRRQVQLARRALEISPDCADAYTLLAERTADLDRQLAYYTQAVQAAERTLDPEIFKAQSGHFWSLIKTRSYMRARLGLAVCLEQLGRLEEAAEHYRELLRLNPNDNQDVRWNLWPCLLRLDQNDEVEALLKRYEDDRGSCMWDYTRALVTFRLKGDGPLARKYLREALNANPLPAHYLLGEEPALEESSEGEEPEWEEDSLDCAEALMEAWDMTPGAGEWLAEVFGRS